MTGNKREVIDKIKQKYFNSLREVLEKRPPIVIQDSQKRPMDWRTLERTSGMSITCPAATDKSSPNIHIAQYSMKTSKRKRGGGFLMSRIWKRKKKSMEIGKIRKLFLLR